MRILLHIPLYTTTPPRPTPTLLPYTPLFRSRYEQVPRAHEPRVLHAAVAPPQLQRQLDVHVAAHRESLTAPPHAQDRKSTRLNSSHRCISYAVFCLKKKKC